MKKLILLFALIPGICFARGISKAELVGIWQADTSLVADAYLDSYQFFQNGRFIFHPNQYDGLERIQEIKGSYTLHNDTLLLKVKSTLELIGGVIQRSRITTLSDSWEVEGGKLVEIKQKPNAEPQTIDLAPSKGKSVNQCLLFDMRPYYKIGDDPNQY